MKENQKFAKSARVMAALAVCLGALLVTGCKKEEPVKSSPTISVASATCVIVPTEGNSCKGIVTFENTPGGVHVVADIKGLSANQKHGFHIHQFGDVSGLDGKSAGGHYDPQDTKNHGQAGDETTNDGQSPEGRPGKGDDRPKSKSNANGKKSETPPNGKEEPAEDSPDAKQKKATGDEKGPGTADNDPNPVF